MRRVFADAVYWIAIVNRKDQWHAKVVSAVRSLGRATLVTTEEVLDEFLAHYSGHGPVLRDAAVQTVERALANPLVVVRPQSHRTFLDGLALYKRRPDKGYSLTDCISMEAMREEGIDEILTHDDHFTQEGFIILL
jgi:predicted nucleic acid-binding protein